jgi:hypothetical protein
MTHILEAESRAIGDRVSLSPPAPIVPSVTKAQSKGMQMVVDRLAEEIDSKINLQDELKDQIDTSLSSDSQEQLLNLVIQDVVVKEDKEEDRK